MASERRSVLFVCLGNICRSPLAEGVLVHHLEEAGIADAVAVDSAGTGAWHAGEAADPRSTAVAAKHGIPLRGQARKVLIEDFHEFDRIFAMDSSNLSDLERIQPGSGSASLELFRTLDPEATHDLDVPDPYYGGPDGFDRVFDMVDRTCRELTRQLLDELG